MELLTATWRFSFDLSIVKKLFLWLLIKSSYYSCLMDHPEMIRWWSSFQGHVQWIWAESFTENLQKRRYSDITVPKLSELSIFCSVINTQSRWLPNVRQVGHHGELKHIFLSNYSPLYPKANFILISLLFFCKKIYGGGSAVYWSIV